MVVGGIVFLFGQSWVHDIMLDRGLGTRVCITILYGVLYMYCRRKSQCAS